MPWFAPLPRPEKSPFVARGRHRIEPARRQFPVPFPQFPVAFPRRIVAATVGGALVAVPLGVAAWQSVSTDGAAVQAAVTTGDRTSSGPASDASGAESYAALDARQLAVDLKARGLARASRGADSSTTRPSLEATAEASATPESTPTEEAPVEPAPVPDVVGQLWATTDVNVRSVPSADGDRIGSLGAITQVDVTGATENGWTQVVIDGQAGWVKSSYLADSEPVPEAAPEPEPEAVSDASCSISAEVESNLTSNARGVYRAVCAAYGGSVSSFGGYRPGDGGDHGSGRAVDIMVSGEAGWEIARYVQSRAAELGVTYVIYEQRIWMAGQSAGNWEWMENRGSSTANHYDHVHVSVS